MLSKNLKNHLSLFYSDPCFHYFFALIMFDNIFSPSIFNKNIFLYMLTVRPDFVVVEELVIILLDESHVSARR